MHLSAVFFSAQSLTKQTTNLPEKQFAIDKFYVISSQGFTNFLFCTKSLTKQTTNLPEKEFAIVKFYVISPQGFTNSNSKFWFFLIGPQILLMQKTSYNKIKKCSGFASGESKKYFNPLLMLF